MNSINEISLVVWAEEQRASNREMSDPIRVETEMEWKFI